MIPLVRILRSLWDLAVILYGLAMMFACMIALPAAMLFLGHLAVPWLWHWIGELGLWWPRAQLIAALAILWWSGFGLFAIASRMVPGSVRKQGHDTTATPSATRQRPEQEPHIPQPRPSTRKPPGPPDYTHDGRVG